MATGFMKRISWIVVVLAGVMLAVGLAATPAFAEGERSIIVEVNGPSACKVTGAGEYEGGVEATLVATPAEGCYFVNWTDEYDVEIKDEHGDAVGATYKFIVEKDRRLTANFALKKSVTITAASDQQVYNGSALTNAKVTVTSGELTEEERLVAEATGSVTNVADTFEGNNGIAAGYKIMRHADNVTDEFAITPVAGTLTITKAPLTITAKDQEYVYNGKQQGEGDPAYDDPAVIAEKVKVEGLQGTDTVASITLDGTETEIGVYKGRIKASNAVIKNTAGEDVTGNYDITYVNGTLTIESAPVQEYTVTFVNWDGTVLQSGKVAKGETPKYEGAEPTRPSDEKYTYAFSGWEPAIVEVTGDATYTAKYTETPKGEPAYKVVSGAGGTWTQGSSSSMTFKVERTVDPETAYSHFTGILVDGKAVPEKDASGKANWTARSGSVIVELQPSYLATLSAGKHTVTVTFDDADPVSADFTVSAKAATPATGDSLPGATVVLIVVALVALGAAIAAFVVRRRIRS